jgi:hypothetical protein
VFLKRIESFEKQEFNSSIFKRLIEEVAGKQFETMSNAFNFTACSKASGCVLITIFVLIKSPS